MSTIFGSRSAPVPGRSKPRRLLALMGDDEGAVRLFQVPQPPCIVFAIAPERGDARGSRSGDVFARVKLKPVRAYFGGGRMPICKATVAPFVVASDRALWVAGIIAAGHIVERRAEVHELRVLDLRPHIGILLRRIRN